MKLNGEELKNVHFKCIGLVMDTDSIIDREVHMIKQEETDRSVVRPEDSPQAQSESIRDHSQTGSDVWERMLGDEREQHDGDCYHGDEDPSRDPRSLETRPHAKRRHSPHITLSTDRRGLICAVAVFVGLDMSKEDMRTKSPAAITFSGIYIDRHLTWKKHIHIICSKISKATIIINRVKHFFYHIVH